MNKAETLADVLSVAEQTKREQRLRAFWAGQGGQRVAVSVLADGHNFRQLDNDDDVVENAVQHILASTPLSADNVPWFGPDFGTISTAVAWGGRVEQPAGGKVFIHPIITCPEEADRVLTPDPAAGHVPRAVRLFQQVRERLATDQLWGRVIDFQGPLSTAALLWEQQDFMCSMYTAPDAVHRFLDRVTDYLIGFMRAHRAGMGRLSGMVWPYIWMPDDLGVVFTEDFMPLLSADLYKEFGIPYMKRLADAFGGVFIHCCGEFEQHLPTLAASGVRFRGFDYCEPFTRTAAMYEAFGPDLIYHLILFEPGVKIPGGMPGFIRERLRKTAPRDMRFWFCTGESQTELRQTIRECLGE